jgi:hypothetical protein
MGTTSKETSKEASTEVVRAGIMMNENRSGSGAREQSYDLVSADVFEVAHSDQRLCIFFSQTGGIHT